MLPDFLAVFFKNNLQHVELGKVHLIEIVRHVEFWINRGWESNQSVMNHILVFFDCGSYSVLQLLEDRKVVACLEFVDPVDLLENVLHVIARNFLNDFFEELSELLIAVDYVLLAAEVHNVSELIEVTITFDQPGLVLVAPIIGQKLGDGFVRFLTERGGRLRETDLQQLAVVAQERRFTRIRHILVLLEEFVGRGFSLRQLLDGYRVQNPLKE